MLGVAVCSVLVLAVAAWWLGRNELPDGYQNEFIHLFTLGDVWFRLREGGLSEAWPFLWDEYYPPLLHAPAGVAMSLLGRSRTIAVLALGLWLVPLLFATAALARRVGDRGAGWVPGAQAVAVLAFAPAIFGNVRRYEPNVAVAACVALGLWWLARGGLRERRGAVIFGLICAAGLLVDRLVFAVYLAAPVTVMMVRGRRWRDWATVAGVVLLLAGYFYARFVVLHSDEITSQLGGEISSAGDVSTLPPWTLRGLLYYPLSWADGGFGLLPALWIGGGLALWGARARRQADPDARAVLESALLFGFALFTVLGKKQPYYAIPLMAPAAVLAAAGWAAVVPRGRPQHALLAAVALIGVNQLAFLSTGAPLVPLGGKATVLVGASPLPDGFLGHEYVMAGPPFEQGLRLEHAAALCEGVRPPGEDPGVTLLLSEGQAAYEGQVMPTLRLLLDTRLVPGMLMEPEAWLESAPSAHCFVYISRDPARDWPDSESIGALFAQWSYDPPSAALLAQLDRVRRRSRPLGTWVTEPGEAVHVVALAPGSGRAPF